MFITPALFSVDAWDSSGREQEYLIVKTRIQHLYPLYSILVSWCTGRQVDGSQSAMSYGLITTCRSINMTSSLLGFFLLNTRQLDRLCPNAINMSRAKRICVFEHSVMTNFNCACQAIQRGQGSGFLSEGSS